MTEQEIRVEDIKTSFNDREFFDDSEKTKLKNKRMNANYSTILFAEMFFMAYSTFTDNVHLIKDNVLLKLLKDLRESAEKLRDLLEEYGDGNDIGDFYISDKVKGIVNKNRKEMAQIINLFDRVFLEGDFIY